MAVFDDVRSFAGVSCVLLAVYVAAKLIYRIYFHPLAKYPGPFLAKISPLALYMSVFRQDRTLWFHELLQKHGSPIRVASDQLVFSDAKSWNDIYGQSSNPCLKDPEFYEPFTVTGAVNVFNAVRRPQHARVRRLLSHGFALQTILQSADMIAARVQTLVDVTFAPNSDGKSIDINDKIHQHYLDIISHLSFGESFNCVSGENPSAPHDVNEFLNYTPAVSFFPFLKYLPIKRIEEGRQAIERLLRFSRSKVATFVQKYDDPKMRDALQTCLLKNLVEAVDPESGSRLSMEELVENTIIFLVAGEGTTAVTTLYAIWETCQRPEVREKVTTEIRGAFPDPKIAPTYEVASKLPYFNCVIEETLRVHGPLNGLGPRVSPGRDIAGHFIPKGIVVGVNPYSTARNPEIYPDPDEYIPERWLTATPEMKHMNRPFSVGPRNCIGKHVAEVGLTVTLARILQLFDLSLDDSMKADNMRPKDRGVIDPWDERLVVVVRKAGASGGGA